MHVAVLQIVVLTVVLVVAVLVVRDAHNEDYEAAAKKNY